MILSIFIGGKEKSNQLLHEQKMIDSSKNVFLVTLWVCKCCYFLPLV